MEQERHGSIFNTQSKDFPQRRIPPFRSARAWHSLLAERHTEKRKVLEEKETPIHHPLQKGLHALLGGKTGFVARFRPSCCKSVLKKLIGLDFRQQFCQ